LGGGGESEKEVKGRDRCGNGGGRYKRTRVGGEGQ